MKKGKLDWNKAIYLASSTSDIVKSQNSADYVPCFIEGKELNSYKCPKTKKRKKEEIEEQN